jgi:hypothetical protein
LNTLRPGRLLLVLLRNRNVKEKRSFVCNMAFHADKRVGLAETAYVSLDQWETVVARLEMLEKLRKGSNAREVSF